jgi:hypothetical protein
MHFLPLFLMLQSVAFALPRQVADIQSIDPLQTFEYVVAQMTTINMELQQFNGSPEIGSRLVRHTQEVLQSMDESISLMDKTEGVGFFSVFSWVSDGLKRLQQSKEFAGLIQKKKILIQKASLGPQAFVMLDQYYRVNKKMLDVFTKKFPSFLESTIKWFNSDAVDQLKDARDAFKTDATNPSLTVVYEQGQAQPKYQPLVQPRLQY